MAAVALLENRKIAISPQSFDRYLTKFDIVTRIGTTYNIEDLKSQFQTSKMADGRHHEYRKITIF